jgi:hypothetical protein
MAYVTRSGLAGLGAAVGVVVAAVYRLSSSPSPVPYAVLTDTAVVALLGGAVVIATGRRESRWAARVPWVISGALLSAATVGTFTIALWLFIAALAFAAAGLQATRGRRRAILGPLALMVGGAVLNLILFAPFATGAPMRTDPAEFLSMDLRVHTFLDDVPLHDVWVFHLRGGGEGRTLRDVWDAVSERPRRMTNPVIVALVGVRMALGWVFGWDDGDDGNDGDGDGEPGLSPSSYAHRLTEADRARSLQPPGQGGGLFQSIYMFERESLSEIMNDTVHAFFAEVLVPSEDGYTLYRATYVKRTSWLTPVYMAAINPFRRLFVWPNMVRTVEEAWALRWGSGQDE